MAWLADRVGAVARRGRVAVLRGDDQRAGRAPRCCVKTGVPTQGATTVRAVALARADGLQTLVGSGLVRLAALVLRRRALDVVVAVSPDAWRRWQRSLTVAVTVGMAGAGLLAFGVVGAGPTVVIGAVLLTLGWMLRVRAVLRWWIGVRYRPDRDEIVVTRVSSGFDGDARRLFARAVLG
jgi:hypothetical protein